MKVESVKSEVPTSPSGELACEPKCPLPWLTAVGCKSLSAGSISTVGCELAASVVCPAAQTARIIYLLLYIL